MTQDFLTRFAPLLRSVSEAMIRTDCTLEGRLVLARDGDFAISWAPFDHVNLNARVVLVGLTPGRQQAANALIAARAALLSGARPSDAARVAKEMASFSGSMRPNLIAMLDHVELNRMLGLQSSGELFANASPLVHYTSALRHPVLRSGGDYNGSRPTSVPILRRMVLEHLTDEVRLLPEAVWIPLGAGAQDALSLLADRGILVRQRILEGLPHPSGANAERIAYFLGRKDRAQLSAKTNPARIDGAHEMLHAKMLTLSGQAIGG